MRFLKYLVFAIVVFATIIWYINEYTDYGFAPMFREDRCLDNGGKWDKATNHCTGGLYGDNE